MLLYCKLVESSAQHATRLGCERHCRGIIVYGMVVGQLPFTTPYTDHGRKQRLINQIRRGLTPRHENEMKLLSTDLRTLLRQTIEPNPLLRVSLPELMNTAWVTQSLRHPLIAFCGYPRNSVMRSQVRGHTNNFLHRTTRKYCSLY